MDIIYKPSALMIPLCIPLNMSGKELKASKYTMEIATA